MVEDRTVQVEVLPHRDVSAGTSPEKKACPGFNYEPSRADNCVIEIQDEAFTGNTEIACTRKCEDFRHINNLCRLDFEGTNVINTDTFEDTIENAFSVLSDSAIDLASIPLEKTSSINNELPESCCRCRCHIDTTTADNIVSRDVVDPESTSTQSSRAALKISVSLPIYSNGSFDTPRTLSKQLWLSLQHNSSNQQPRFVTRSENSNNNHRNALPTVSSPKQDQDNVSSCKCIGNCSSLKYSGKNEDLEESYSSSDKQSRSCLEMHKGVLLLIVILTCVTVATVATLVYFGVDSTGDPRKVPEIPDSRTSINQTLFCGRYPPEYQTSDLTMRSQFSQYPFNPIFPVNDNRTTIRGRIIGGEPANIKQYPWQVSIWLESYDGSSSVQCGGSVILNNWIITAAHCIEEQLDPKFWTAFVGMSALSRRYRAPAQTRKVIGIFPHQDYTTELSYDYDIALIWLESGLQYNEFVQPICVPPQGFEFKHATKCFVSGWGTTSLERPHHPDVLHHAQVDIIDRKICGRTDWLGELVTGRMVCAGKEEGRRDACQGDSGGPLSCYDPDKAVYMLAGSVSWGIGCGIKKSPGVYARTSSFTHWIWTTIGLAQGWIRKEFLTRRSTTTSTSTTTTKSTTTTPPLTKSTSTTTTTSTPPPTKSTSTSTEQIDNIPSASSTTERTSSPLVKDATTAPTSGDELNLSRTTSSKGSSSKSTVIATRQSNSTTFATATSKSASTDSSETSLPSFVEHEIPSSNTTLT